MCIVSKTGNEPHEMLCIFTETEIKVFKNDLFKDMNTSRKGHNNAVISIAGVLHIVMTLLWRLMTSTFLTMAYVTSITSYNQYISNT